MDTLFFSVDPFIGDLIIGKIDFLYTILYVRFTIAETVSVWYMGASWALSIVSGMYSG